MARLIRAGLIGVDRYIGMAGTAHALGTLVTGTDPTTSVTDADGNVHGMQASTSATAASCRARLASTRR
jgi:choline dehydrogenase-like flavoprotein